MFLSLAPRHTSTKSKSEPYQGKERLERLERLVEKGMIILRACGVCVQTVLRWLFRGNDEDFILLLLMNSDERIANVFRSYREPLFPLYVSFFFSLFKFLFPRLWTPKRASYFPRQ